MNRTTTSKPIGIYLLLLCLLFIGFGGLYGGVAFLQDPSGALLGMTPEALRPLPLESYFVPGLFLLTVMGIIPLLLAVGLWQRTEWLWGQGFHYLTHEHWTWTATALFAYVLLGWLLFEMLLFGFGAPIQWGITGVAVLLYGLCHLPSVRQYCAVPR